MGPVDAAGGGGGDGGDGGGGGPGHHRRSPRRVSRAPEAEGEPGRLCGGFVGNHLCGSIWVGKGMHAF